MRTAHAVHPEDSGGPGPFRTVCGIRIRSIGVGSFPYTATGIPNCAVCTAGVQ